MSANDKTLIDMAVTNTVKIRAIEAYLEEQGVDLQPYIDAELKKREEEAKKMAAAQEDLQRQATEQLKAAQQEAGPPEGTDDDAPLQFGGDVGEAEAEEASTEA